MAPDRIALGGGDDRIALAQEAAQHGVDEGGALGRADVHRRDRLVDERVAGVGRVVLGPEQRERGQQQRIDPRRRQLRHQLGARRLGRAETAQHLEGKRLRTGARRGRTVSERFGQRSAGAHPLHRVGGVVEQLGQRQGFTPRTRSSSRPFTVADVRVYPA